MKNGGQFSRVLMRSNRISPEPADTSIPAPRQDPAPAARHERYPFPHPRILLPPCRMSTPNRRSDPGSAAPHDSNPHTALTRGDRLGVRAKGPAPSRGIGYERFTLKRRNQGVWRTPCYPTAGPLLPRSSGQGRRGDRAVPIRL